MFAKTLTAITLTTMMFAAPAKADIYFGGGAQLTAPFYVAGWETVEPQHFGSYDIHAGFRYGLAAIEAGYQLSSASEGQHHLAMSGLTLDALLFAPVRLAGAQPFVTFGTTDILARSADISTDPTPINWAVTTTPIFRSQNWDWRAGAGLEFRLSDILRSRITARYQDFTFQQHMHGGVTFGISLDMHLD